MHNIAKHTESPLNGGLRLLDEGLDEGTRRVEEFHHSISERPYRSLQYIPFLNLFSRPIELAQNKLTQGIYQALRKAGHIVLNNAINMEREQQRHLPPAVQAAGTDTVVGAAINSAINGAIGDHLENTDNPLSLSMGFYHQNKPLALNADSLQERFPKLSGKVCIMVHGLCVNEGAWQSYSQQHWGKKQDFGQLLKQELGYSPFYVRYNSGRHISHNGRDLDLLIEELIKNYPAKVDDIVIIGHSMGGLIARSANHFTASSHTRWHTKLSQVICLGSPHLGAPLEQVAHLGTALLDQMTFTRPIAKIIKQRSIGIKDLRYGYVTDEDWQSQDQDSLEGNKRKSAQQLQHVKYSFIGSSLSDDTQHPVAHTLGDILVPVKSATGQHQAEELCVSYSEDRYKLLGGINHIALQNHPEAYQQIKAWLS
jgi:pimeloyl-ACP methyl ester carboxylesterase